MSRPHNPVRGARHAHPLWPLLCSCAVLLALASASLARGARRQQPSAPGPTLRFAHGGNAAEVPLEISSNAVFVPVRVNQGLPAGWLLDTGSRRTVAASPLDSGSSAREAGKPPILSLPGVSIVGVTPEARSLGSLGPWYGRRVHGVIGDDLLAHVVAQLNYSRRSIQLYEPASYHPPRHAKALDILWIDGLPAVRVRLRLAGHTVTGNFVLNTGGNAGVVVSKAFLASQRLYPYKGKTIPGTIFGAAGERSASVARGEWLQFGHWRITGPLVAIEGANDSPAAGAGKRRSKDRDHDVDGWIGGQILRKFQVVIDFPGRRIFLTPNPKFIFPVEADASGATVVAAGPSLGQFEIRRVVPGSPADAAGLMPGDRILVIDSERASDFSLDQVRALFCGAGHAPVVMSVLRLGRRVRIVLHLRKRL